MTVLDGVNGTLCNAEQYQQSLLSYNNRSPSISCLTRGDTIGLVSIVAASLISLISVVAIFICMGWNVRWYRKMFPARNWKLFQRPPDIYMFSLFVFDGLQAIDGILNIRWIHSGIVTTGPYCTAQGVLGQIGELGVALLTLLLAVHTFVAAVLQIGLKARGVAFGLVCLACVFNVLWAVIGASIHKDFETPVPYWCWIGPRYSGERFGGETAWMWAALVASVILYIPLYFWAEGFWSIDEGYRFHWRDSDQRIEYTQRRATLRILLYPVAYSLVILPLTIVRCLEYGHHNFHKVSPAATFFVVSVFYLSGVVNVVLFLLIRPRLLLFLRPAEAPNGQQIRLPRSPQSTGPANFSDAEKFQHSPEPTSPTVGDESSTRDSATPSHTKTRQI